jgi:ATP-binding cassette subfamily F protein 3
MIATDTAPGVTIEDGVSIGYYRQDFHNFDFDSTVVTCLEEASNRKHTKEEIYKTAASFLLRGKTVMSQQVKTLSEGQKGLLSLACLSLQEPSILIMDEPTNHINFRHLPALAKAVRSFPGAVLLVSHDYHFVDAVGVDSIIDMGKELMMGEGLKNMTA